MINNIHTYKKRFFYIGITISYALWAVMNKSLHITLVNICTSGSHPLLMSSLVKHTTDCFTVSYRLLVSVDVQQDYINVNGCNFFQHGGIQWITFASYALSREMPLCQTAICNTTAKSNRTVAERFDFYWQRNEIGSVIFRLAFIFSHYLYYTNILHLYNTGA